MRSTTVAALAAALCLAASTCAAAPAGSLEEKVLEAGEICDDVKQYSGYYHLNTHDAHYFYWAFESRTPSNVTIMWLTGGPGCSSSVALFGENGPCKVSADATQTTKNPYSWNTNANLVYVDQPAGTGFSYGSGMDHNESQVSADLYDFVQQFMKAHPQFADDSYFLVGESYAGHYVPATARAIFDGNQNLGPGDIKINLAGFGIGNGLVDPETQYGYYADMAISSNDHEPAVSNTTYKIMKAATPSCVKSIAACQNSSVACVLATDVCNAALLLPYQFTGMNPYDMREKCKVPPLCYNFSNVAAYLARADVRQTLGVDPKRKWQDCNHLVALSFELAGDWMHNFQELIPAMLEGGVRGLIYAGDQDYICNWLGNQAWSLGLEWAHQADFNSTSPQTWTVDGEEAGSIRSSHGFTFARVKDAGHMVPRDQPKNALDLIQSFVAGKF